MFPEPELYLPDPMLIFVAQGYQPSPERLVTMLLDELGIRVEDE